MKREIIIDKEIYEYLEDLAIETDHTVDELAERMILFGITNLLFSLSLFRAEIKQELLISLKEAWEEIFSER